VPGIGSSDKDNNASGGSEPPETTKMKYNEEEDDYGDKIDNTDEEGNQEDEDSDRDALDDELIEFHRHIVTTLRAHGALCGDCARSENTAQETM